MTRSASAPSATFSTSWSSPCRRSAPPVRGGPVRAGRSSRGRRPGRHRRSRSSVVRRPRRRERRRRGRDGGKAAQDGHAGLRATVFHGWACSGECRVGHRAWLRVQPARRCNYLTTRTTPLKLALLRARHAGAAAGRCSAPSLVHAGAATMALPWALAFRNKARAMTAIYLAGPDVFRPTPKPMAKPSRRSAPSSASSASTRSTTPCPPTSASQPHRPPGSTAPMSA